MTFAWPYLLWILIVPVGLLLLEVSRRRRIAGTAHEKILRAEAGAHSLRLTTAAAQGADGAHRIRPWLCLGLTLAVVAAARPQWGRLEEPVFDQSREILIAIDLSRSMLTPDVRPSRLDRAKLLTQSLLEKLAGERVGLVVFSGTAFLQSPLSSDYEILREFLPSLNPAFLPEGGTNYRALIDTSIDAFRSTAAADRFLIVLSDGEATTNDWRERVGDLKKKEIRVIGLGVGTTAGAMIPDGAGGLVKDERGAVVMSKLESGTLRELADATNGMYQDASNWIDLAALVSATVESGKKGEFTEKNSVRLVERFQWPLGLALWCLFVSFYYEFPVRPRPRELKLTVDPASPKISGKQAVASATMILALFAMGLVTSVSRAATAPTTATPTPAPLTTIVGRLSSGPEPTARDWAEFGRETVTWGSKLQSHQQPVPEGPVRDALVAVELGSKLDSKTADWAKLREELEALLKKPEEQKQEQKKDDQKNQDQKDQDQQQQNKDQKQDQQKSDEQKQDNQKQDNPSQPQKDPANSKDPSEQKDPSDQKPNRKDAQNKESAFGDMKKQDQPPPPPENSQKVGGAPKKDESDQPPIDPSLALPLQKLDQLRNQDSPAELFKMMEGERDPTPRKKTKDW
ncbi:MAG: VWA domain-containing protein [Opitutus sp.]